MIDAVDGAEIRGARPAYLSPKQFERAVRETVVRGAGMQNQRVRQRGDLVRARIDYRRRVSALVHCDGNDAAVRELSVIGRQLQRVHTGSVEGGLRKQTAHVRAKC